MLVAVLALVAAGVAAPPLAPAVQAAPALPLSQSGVSVATSGGSIISAGYYHTCAIKTDGTLACWGDNTYGQAPPTPPSGTYTAVSAGWLHTCAIKTDGTLACWGYNYFGQAPPTPPSGTYIAVSAGGYHTCAIKTDGTLACWGRNDNGQAPPTPPSGTYTAVSAGLYHTCAIKTDGTLACWGYNGYGQAPPTPPSGTYTAVSAGYGHTCAIKTDGTLACWGRNVEGQLSGMPPGTFGGARLPAVSAGSYHTCAIKTDGTLACWGSNTYGQAPRTPPSGTYTAVSAGDLHTCAVKTDGTLACWGYNGNGQAPPAPSGTYTAVSAGHLHTCAIKTDGTLACWGRNDEGQAPPTPPSGTYTAISADWLHTCAVKTDGTLACWGDNGLGQAPPAPSGTYTAVSAGAFHTCAVKTDGTLACWGYNGSGRATPPSGAYTAVSAGYGHTCAIKTDGTLACWGDNDDGQAPPTPPSGTYTAVSAGYYHTCAIKTDGTLACWGRNDNGQSTLPAVTLSVSGFPSPTTAGAAHNVTVTAVDAFGNTVTGYAGTVHFTSSDGAALLAGDATLTAGTGTFSVTLNTAGTQWVTATDTVTASITGSQTGIAVQAGTLDHLVLSPSDATISAGASQAYTAQGADAHGNGLGDLTAATTFTISGGGSCSGTSCTSTVAGDHTVTGTDGSFTGTATLHVVPAALDHLVLSPSDATIVAGAGQAYSAQGFDASNNSLGDVTSATTFTISGAGSCTGASCTSTVPGDHTVTGTDGSATGTATLHVVFTGATFHAITPGRVLDSRIALGASVFHSRTKQSFQVTGLFGVPAGAVAVTGNVTIVGQNRGGYVTIAPSLTSGTQPGTSTINFPLGDIRANGITVSLGAGGKLDAMYWSSSAADLVNVLFDVTGYFAADVTGATFHAITPGRVLDSRSSTGAGTFHSRTKQSFQVTGLFGVPAGAVAVTGNVTVVGQTRGGYVTVAPSLTSGTQPGTSTINFPLGDIRANGVTVALGAAGTLDAMYWSANAADTVHVLFDVTGYFANDATGATFHAITPGRVLDSRIALGASVFHSRTKQSFAVSGLFGVPAGAVAVTGNVTVVYQVRAGYVTVAPSLTSGTQPGTSTINFPLGDIRANGITVSLGAGGKLDAMYWSASTADTVHVLFDVTGYFN